MQHTVKKITAALSLAFATVFFVAPNLSATDYSASGGITSAGGGGNGGMSTATDPAGIVNTIVQIAMYAVGIISVIIIIFAGIMYATAAGDESKVKKAKHALIGAVIGLAIALLAFAITSFVNQKL
jgi:lysylphosphatidylglycerol synthetase-like protein (DUF2156 family)